MAKWCVQMSDVRNKTDATVKGSMKTKFNIVPMPYDLILRSKQDNNDIKTAYILQFYKMLM